MSKGAEEIHPCCLGRYTVRLSEGVRWLKLNGSMRPTPPLPLWVPQPSRAASFEFYTSAEDSADTF